jgi:cysteinyl-tRNA synthetase
MHNGFVQVEGKKMAKSEGNFVTINDLLHTDKFGGRKWPGEVLRLAMLMTHYREPIDFSERRLKEAENILLKWSRTLRDSDTEIDPNERRLGEAVEVLGDDLNTPRLISWLSQTCGDLRSREDRRGWLLGRYLLGIELTPVETLVAASSLDDDINRRLVFLAEKNFAEADKIRDELAEQGIQLMDYKDPDTGERRTKWEVKR